MEYLNKGTEKDSNNPSSLMVPNLNSLNSSNRLFKNSHNNETKSVNENLDKKQKKNLQKRLDFKNDKLNKLQLENDFNLNIVIH